MRRREFSAGALLSLVSGFARAQETHRQVRIGYLALLKNERLLEVLRASLAHHGYSEGSNLALTEFSAQGEPGLLDRAATDLVSLSPQVIVAVGNAAARAALRATRTIPIIVAPTGDALGTGLVKSLAAPEGNLTGLSLDTWTLNEKRLEALKEAFERVRRVAVLANFANPSAQDQWEITARGARALGLEPTLAKVRDRGDLNAALSEVARDRPDALHVVSDALFDAARDEIVRFASLERLPAVYEHRAFTESGGLMSYGPNLDRVTTRAAWYIVKILQGTRPGELPVEAPTHFELVVNLRAAKAMGIQISPLVLSRADEVIE